MRFKALTGFSGKVSASKGSEIEIADEAIAKDLLNAGYIELAEDPDLGKTGKKLKVKTEKPVEAEAKAETEKPVEAEKE